MVTPVCPKCGAYALLPPDDLSQDPITWKCVCCKHEVQWSPTGKKCKPPLKPSRARKKSDDKPSRSPVKCPCGLPLHYSNPDTQAKVESLIAELGSDVLITVPGVGSWMVPRHYIALHQLKAAELPRLALRFNFRQVVSTIATRPSTLN